MSKGFFTGSELAQSKRPAPTVARCGACGLFKGCKSPYMPPTGDGRLGVLVVAEAPGYNEDVQNKQLVGDAGQELRKYLKRIDVDLDRDCWKTNAIICRPPSNRKPTDDEIDYCRPNLTKVLKELKPKVIITLGIAAVRAVVGSVWKEDVGAMAQWVGWRVPDQSMNAWICPTYHPSFVMRSKADTKHSFAVLSAYFQTHLEMAFKLKKRPWEELPQYDSKIDVVLNPAEAAHIIRRYANWRFGYSAFDYETNMLKPDGSNARIVSCSICWGTKKKQYTIAYPWHGEARIATQEYLRSDIPKIASNMKFEDRWTRKEFGHRVRNWAWDTMLAGHVLDNRDDITGLKFQSYVRLGQPLYNEHIEPFLKAKGTRTPNQILSEISIEHLLKYNGVDSLLELLVAYDQMKEMGC